MTDNVTIFNAHRFRLEFCKDSGHTYECVEDTVNDMLMLMAKSARVFNIPIEYAVGSVYNNIDVDLFHDYMCKILSTKLCECDKAKKVVLQ